MITNKKALRVFFIFLALVLALAPMSIMAETDTNKTIQYVALGDSLAAGLLSDGKTIGTGYTGNIKKSLESNGYQVTLTNKGVPGYTSEQVLNGLDQIQELSSADLITISAGANDLLKEIKEINFQEISKLDPNYFNPTKIGEMQNTLNQQLQTIFSQGESYLTQLNDTLSNIELDLPSPLSSFVTNFNNAKQDISEAVTKLGEAKTAFENNNDYVTLLKEALAKLNSGITNLNNLITTAQNFVQFYPQLEPYINSISPILESINPLLKNANDTLKNYEEMEDNLKLVQDVQQKLNNAQQKISTVSVNITNTITKIKQVNPDVKIYVMGYYNALPYLSNEVQQFTVPIIESLNQAIKSVVNSAGATFISTYSLFEGNYETYLPNQSDIHPNEEGYSVIANAFMSEINKTFPPIKEETPKEETEIEIKLDEKVAVQKGQQITIQGTNVTLVLPSDLPAGTVLTVTKSSDDKIEKAKGLKAVGDVLNFNFDFPNGFENYTGKYQLIMGYDDDSDNVDIYYYDEQSEQWVKQNGQLNKQLKEISLEVTHFSNYGVFAQVSSNGGNNEDSENNETDDETNGNENEPNDSEDSDDGEMYDDTTDNQSDDNIDGTGKKLPKTATNYYNWMLVGFIMIAVGVIYWKRSTIKRVLTK